MFHFSNCSTGSKCYGDSNKLVNGKMKDKTDAFAIKELVGLKPKMCSFLIDDSSGHNKANGVHKYTLQQ